MQLGLARLIVLRRAVQVLGWVMNRGPLVRPLTPVQFLAVYALPITPREGACAGSRAMHLCLLFRPPGCETATSLCFPALRPPTWCITRSSIPEARAALEPGLPS